MKIFRTGSPAIVRECQFNSNFVPIQSWINICTARFLHKFIVSENSLCSLFAINSAYQLLYKSTITYLTLPYSHDEYLRQVSLKSIH